MNVNEPESVAMRRPAPVREALENLERTIMALAETEEFVYAAFGSVVAEKEEVAGDRVPTKEAPGCSVVSRDVNAAIDRLQAINYRLRDFAGRTEVS